MRTDGKVDPLSVVVSGASVVVSGKRERRSIFKVEMTPFFSLCLSGGKNPVSLDLTGQRFFSWASTRQTYSAISSGVDKLFFFRFPPKYNVPLH